MADVEVTVSGRRYKLSCRDGEEDHLRALVRMVDLKAEEITGALGEMTETRTLLLSALLIADELNDLRGAAAVARNEPPADVEPDPAYAVAIERIAERVERLASQLERPGE
ncbi:cell division protein ZapA [Rhizorhabdus argentea]|uniref:cell division protein ZapA n=1 Tax=Rhizorhabdus argentea TaxID=1387174 RepID=UPI0030ED2E7A